MSPVGSVVAITNQKGGVGKTTTAVNLAASLAVAEQRVLLIDMDPQGNATSGVGVAPRSVQRGTYDVLVGRESIRDAARTTDLGCLKLVGSGPDLAAVEIEFVDLDDRATRLKQAIETVKDDYDFILIDCPPSLGLLTLNALTAADAVLVPMQCEYYALEGISHLMSTVERIKAALNPALYVHGVLLTMFDPRSNLANQVADELRQHFPVYETVIPRNVRLAEAPSHGKPIILYDAGSKGSQGYLSLAREILDRLPEAAA
jgi:chromosome partitioning protein